MAKKIWTGTDAEVGMAVIRSVRQNIGIQRISEIPSESAAYVGRLVKMLGSATEEAALPYEKTNVSMPVCAGDWWWQRPDSTSWEIVHVVTSRSRGLRWKGFCVHELGGFWTGPIPVPEDKPAEEGPSQMDFGEPCKSCAYREPTLQGWGFRPCAPARSQKCWRWKPLKAGALDPPNPIDPVDPIPEPKSRQEAVIEHERPAWAEMVNGSVTVQPPEKGDWIAGEDGLYLCAVEVEDGKLVSAQAVNPPEDKPAPVRAHCPDAVEKANASAREVCDAMDRSALSVGERWGKLLHGLRSKIARKDDCTFPWKTLTKARRKMWIDTALLFRTECVAEVVKRYEELVEAAKESRKLPRGNMVGVLLDEAISALSAPVPSAPDEPPKPKSHLSDEELGRYAQDTLHMYLGESVSICLGANDLREYGAAIRAKFGEK